MDNRLQMEHLWQACTRAFPLESLDAIQRQVTAALKASKATAAPRSGLPDPTKPLDVLRLLPLSVQNCLPEARKLKLPVNPAPEAIADGFQLNRKQRLRSTSWRNGSQSSSPETMLYVINNRTWCCATGFPGSLCRKYSTDVIRLFLAGPAGTGKSHVIAAIQFLFSLYGKRDWLLLTATTGTASVSISGATVHSALGLRLYGSTEEDDAHSSSNQPNDVVNCSLNSSSWMRFMEQCLCVEHTFVL